MTLLRIYLQDEAPAIGCGWRRVRLVSLGWKWVKIECPTTGRRARLHRKTWDPIADHAQTELEAHAA